MQGRLQLEGEQGHLQLGEDHHGDPVVGQEEEAEAGEGAVPDQWAEQAGEARDHLCIREGGPGQVGPDQGGPQMDLEQGKLGEDRHQLIQVAGGDPGPEAGMRPDQLHQGLPGRRSRS